MHKNMIEKQDTQDNPSSGNRHPITRFIRRYQYLIHQEEKDTDVVAQLKITLYNVITHYSHTPGVNIGQNISTIVESYYESILNARSTHSALAGSYIACILQVLSLIGNEGVRF